MSRSVSQRAFELQNPPTSREADPALAHSCAIARSQPGGAGVGISQEEAEGHGLGRRRGTEVVVGKVGLQASCAPCRARPPLPEGRCESCAGTEEDVPGSDPQRGGRRRAVNQRPHSVPFSLRCNFGWGHSLKFLNGATKDSPKSQMKMFYHYRVPCCRSRAAVKPSRPPVHPLVFTVSCVPEAELASNLHAPLFTP